MRLLIALGTVAVLVHGVAVAQESEHPLEINERAHTAWKVGDGTFKDPISSIAQTPDGYLWLGTQFGLLRFDGIRHVLWHPPAGQRLPSVNIRTLFVSTDGRLWIGTQLGLASLKDGALSLYPEVPGHVGGMLEDRDGTMWAGTRYPPPGMLCELRRDRVQCYGEKGEFGARASSVFEDRAGNLWVGADTGLWRWKPGTPTRYPLQKFESSRGLLEIHSGGLLIAERDRLKQLLDGSILEWPRPGAAWQAQFSRLYRDRRGALWIGTFDHGLIHVYKGRVDSFSQADGLSGNYVRDILEDREGNIWVATGDGLDRFRRTAVGTISTRHGLSEATAWTVLAARDGSVWVGTLNGLNRLQDGRITVYRRRATRKGSADRPAFVTEARQVIDRGLPSDVIQSMYEDHQQRLWVSTHNGVARLVNGRFRPLPGIPSGVQAITGDTAGHVWISHDEELLRLDGDRIVERVSWSRLGLSTPAVSLLADPVGGGLWLGFRDGSGVAYFRAGRIVASYNSANGLGRGIVGGMHRDADGTLWVATEEGLSRIRNGRMHTLGAKDGLPCDPVHWVIEDDAEAFWLYTACGLARVQRSQVDDWAAAAEAGRSWEERIAATVFDDIHGVRIHASAGHFTPQVTKDVDGRIWFLPWNGVSVVDPRRLVSNTLPPPVHIEQITADSQSYPIGPDLRLPPRVRDVAIDYTALSLVAPDKVRFRYKLEGQDPDWKEVVNQRRVQYSNLPPGTYRFRVTAGNNDAAWNEAGAQLQFVVAAAYYQTRWFQALCAITFVGLLWTAYRIHVRRLVRELNVTLEARVAERTRIARDLHDTLLQSFQGVVLLFESARRLLPERPAEARQRLEGALVQATQATTEARQAVQRLRSSAAENTDPVGALTRLVEQLKTDETGAGPHVRVTSHGPPRAVKAVVGDEVHFIAAEAVRNAVRHAGAEQITVELCHEDRQYRVRIRDDGRGFDARALRRDAPPGHFGLPGMRERAELVGGSLEVWSKPGFGTRVELSIPAAIAYTTPPPPRSRRFRRARQPRSEDPSVPLV